MILMSISFREEASARFKSKKGENSTRESAQDDPWSFHKKQE